MSGRGHPLARVHPLPRALPRWSPPRPRPTLLGLELRRNPDLWILVLVAAIFAWVGHFNEFSRSTLYWTDASIVVRQAAIVLGPAAAGVAARAAARDRWCGLEELIGTTARPEGVRRLTSWAAVAVACVAAHLLLAVYVVARTATEVVWDGPYYAAMLAGPAAVVATSALGYAVGAAWSGRFAAPVVTIGAFLLVLQGANREEETWTAYISPLQRLDASPWTGIAPDLGPLPALFYLAVAGIFLGTLAFRRSRPLPLAVIGVSATLAVAVAAAIAARVPEGTASATAPPPGWGTIHPNAPAAGTYEPICGDGLIPVCVHPAHAPYLPTASEQINRALAPITALLDAEALPRRVDLLPRPDPAPPPGVVSRWLSDHIPGMALWTVMVDLAGGAVGAEPTAVRIAGPSGTTDPAQSVVRAHLLRQTGFAVACEEDRLAVNTRDWGSSGFGDAVSCDALDRFAALPVDAQRAWLAANIGALRAGTLTLEDLP